MHNKAFSIVKNPKYKGYQVGLAWMVCKFFDKKLLVAVLKMRIFPTKNELKNYANQILETLRKE